ncbi:P-loop containing nucleoside triphosphate hydrolase protein [Xylaria longipes]|nr:P-loop containing nucleoside triphosphate hydrolase protein [Xylaria longipes]
MSRQEARTDDYNSGAIGSSEEESKEAEKKESRYHMILTEWDSRKGQFQEQSLPGLKDGAPFGPETKPNRAFTFRKITGIRSSRSILNNDFSSTSEVDVVFPPLQKLLGRLTSKWGWAEDVITKCSSPYSALIYAWDEAQKEASAIIDGESDDEKQARDDLKELLRIISSSSGDVRLDRYFKDRQALLSEGTITHEALWTLFPPGRLVVGRPCHDEPQIFVVDSCDKFLADDETFDVVCYSFDWNGSLFSRVPFVIGIDPWGGDRKSVTSLPLYPLELHEENGLSRDESVETLKKRLIERGRKFVSFCIAGKGKQMFKYSKGEAYFHRGGTFLQRKQTDSGTELDDQQDSSSSAISDETGASAFGLRASWKPIEGAVIVNFASYLTYQPKRQYLELSPSRRGKDVFKDMYKFEWDRHPPHRAMSPEQVFCCPPRVLGYALKQKTWVQLLVRYLDRSNEVDDSTFKNELQLDSDAKDLILKSVQAHARSGNRSQGLDDFAPEKGRGLVIMLYGQPGVGKTLTAESVAQMTSKPLLSVGVSDIGIEGDKVELNLQKIFALAGLWEAVLLFDEADVFLESRGEGDNDLQRNAMVSVLLRVLEYYDGILIILTTNRMRSLDIAVQSRIPNRHRPSRQVYVSPDQKTNIYISFLHQLSNKGLVDNLRDLEMWAKKDGKRYDFKGRQIRNVLSTALGIAQAEGRKLDREDLISVARQTDDFKRDLSTQEAIYRDRQINQRT